MFKCIYVFVCVCDIEIFEYFFDECPESVAKKKNLEEKKREEFRMKITEELFRICLFVFLFAEMERIYRLKSDF